MSLEEYFSTWWRVIDKKELLDILTKLNIKYKQDNICPQKNDIFKAFKVCPYNELKVIMVGQDPYPQKGVATGILFGNKKGTEENNLSPSLQVMREAAVNFEVPHNYTNFDITLESWAKQGILMLNSALTVETNKIGSHVMLWRPFISSLLRRLSESETGLVYVLFGKQAQTFKPYINSKFNVILEENHPAYYVRAGKKMPCNIFKQINKVIKGIYGSSIIWYQEY